MVDFMRAAKDPDFWRERYKTFKADPEKTIIEHMDWKKVNAFHLMAIRRHIKPTDKVLDIGCGLGRSAGWFQDNQYVGMDFVPEFLDTAKKNNPKKIFVLADLLKELPFKDKEFEWGLSISTKGPIFNGDIADPTNTWLQIEKNVARVCKRLMVLEYSRFKEVEIITYSL